MNECTLLFNTNNCSPCLVEQASAAPAEAESPTGTAPSTESLKPAKSRTSRGQVAAVQPVMGMSQRVHTGPKKKKDLGVLGKFYWLTLSCVFLFRGRDLKKQHEQRVYEREMQRITLPLSAFSNPTCELVDENTIVITAEHDTDPALDSVEGGDPLMGGQQAGTPGA
uniref:Phosphoinositide-3-kinase interacting protein 1 n=1 Tax=Labrus bergylta TaxID=56723 RepID=A0A3Q3FID9_9LABR